MVASPSYRRSTWQPGITGGVLVIPSRRDVFLMGFLTVWLAGWSVGVLAVPRFLTQPDLFWALWLVIWAPAECFTALVLGYMFAGQEIITLSPRTLSIRLQIFRLGHTWEYDVPAIRTLRHLRQRFLPGNRRSGSSRELLSDFACCIAFNYGARVVGLGRGLTEAEASEVVAELVATGILPTGGVDVSLYRG